MHSIHNEFITRIWLTKKQWFLIIFFPGKVMLQANSDDPDQRIDALWSISPLFALSIYSNASIHLYTYETNVKLWYQYMYNICDRDKKQTVRNQIKELISVTVIWISTGFLRKIFWTYTRHTVKQCNLDILPNVTIQSNLY